MKNDLFFLDYLSRSGSTLLASKLSQIEGIVTTLEPKLVKHSSVDSANLENQEDQLKYMDFLYSQPKFLTWRVDREQLKNALNKHDFPKDFTTVLQELLLLKYPKKPTQKWLIKGGGFYCLNLDDYLALYKEFKVIFIIRDPRAIYNSQINSRDSVRQGPMEDNLIRFISRFRKLHKVLSNPKYKKVVKLVSYEDLVDREDEVINDILSFMGVNNQKSDNDQYFKQIPDSQIHLHQNVEKGVGLLERKEAWQNELDPKQIGALNLCLSKEMSFYGYESQNGSTIKVSYLSCLIVNAFKLLFNRALKTFTARKW